MKSEMKKKKPNRSIIREAMKRTTAHRENYCREHTTADVLQEFPVLKIRLFVSMVFIAIN